MKNFIRIFIAVFILLMGVNSLVCAQDEAKDVFIYDDQNRRDPFWSLVSQEGVIVNYDDDLILSDLRLEGIILDVSGKNLAIVNGQILKSQDKIGPFMIVAIERDHIVIDKKGQQFMLYLKKEE